MQKLLSLSDIVKLHEWSSLISCALDHREALYSLSYKGIESIPHASCRDAKYFKAIYNLYLCLQKKGKVKPLQVREDFIICSRLELFDVKKKTYKELGFLFDVRPSTARDIYKRSLRRLKFKMLNKFYYNVNIKRIKKYD